VQVSALEGSDSRGAPPLSNAPQLGGAAAGTGPLPSLCHLVLSYETIERSLDRHGAAADAVSHLSHSEGFAEGEDAVSISSVFTAGRRDRGAVPALERLRPLGWPSRPASARTSAGTPISRKAEAGTPSSWGEKSRPVEGLVARRPSGVGLGGGGHLLPSMPSGAEPLTWTRWWLSV
jgi:hypothetical protein